MFPGHRVPAQKGSGCPGRHRFLNFGSGGRLPCPLSVGGCHQLTGVVDKLQFQIILILKGMGVSDAGLVKIVVVLIQIVRKKLRGGGGAAFHVRFHVGIIVGGGKSRNGHHADHTQGHQNTYCIEQPAFPQTGNLPH